jgi:hypothetical protein
MIKIFIADALNLAKISAIVSLTITFVILISAVLFSFIKKTLKKQQIIRLIQAFTCFPLNYA